MEPFSSFAHLESFDFIIGTSYGVWTPADPKMTPFWVHFGVHFGTPFWALFPRLEVPARFDHPILGVHFGVQNGVILGPRPGSDLGSQDPDLGYLGQNTPFSGF